MKILICRTGIIIMVILLLQSCLTTRIRIDRLPLEKYLQNDELFHMGFSGFCLYDPVDKKYIYDINGGKFFIPASNMKVFTFYTGKQILGDSLPALRYAIRNDTLYFTGTGDPTFLYPHYENQPVYNLLKNAPDPLCYVTGMYKDPRFGTGWAWDDFPYYYSAERSPFPIYGNSIWIRKSLKDTTFIIEPAYFTSRVEILKDTLVQNGKPALKREENVNRFQIIYSQLPDTLEGIIPYAGSTILTRTLLEDTLERRVDISGSFPDTPADILYSQPVDSLMKPMLIESDNFFAEQILEMSAGLTFDTLKSELAIRYALDSLLPGLRDQMHWVDGSGLSRYNQVTPHAMISIFNRILETYEWDYIRSMFPSGGQSGTLREYYKTQDSHPFITGKTGSMSHVLNLSGYLVTARGTLLIFSFMNNNFNIDPERVRYNMERVLRQIYLTY